jgi:hypothetical protein
MIAANSNAVTPQLKTCLVRIALITILSSAFRVYPHTGKFLRGFIFAFLCDLCVSIFRR